jgi:hypothetical protein
MTAKKPDYLKYEAEQYSIVGVHGTGMMTARQLGLGIADYIRASNCARGYFCTYEVEAGYLFLVKLAMNKYATTPIEGIAPVPDLEDIDQAVYSGLRIKTPFNGGLLAGRDFIESMYVHGGFQLPHRYETLLEFRFEEGNVNSVTDHSAAMAALRQRMRAEKQAWEAAHHAEMEELKRLKKQLNAMSRTVPVPHHLFPNHRSNAGLTPEEVDTKSAAIWTEMKPLQNRIQELYRIIHPDSMAM